MRCRKLLLCLLLGQSELLSAAKNCTSITQVLDCNLKLGCEWAQVPVAGCVDVGGPTIAAPTTAANTTAAPTTVAPTTVAPTPLPNSSTTSTWTAWDSSSGSSGSLDSSGSSMPGSLNQGSSVSASSMQGANGWAFKTSSGDSSGSNASGSSGSYLQIWQWFLLVGFILSGIGGGAFAAASGGKKRTKKSTQKKSASSRVPTLPLTTLQIKHSTGVVTLQVADHSQFQLFQKIVIARGTPVEEANEIVGFGSILLKSPMQFDHPAGTTVEAEPEAPAAAAPEVEPLLNIPPLVPAAYPATYAQATYPTKSFVPAGYAQPLPSYSMPTTTGVQPYAPQFVV